MKKIFGVLSLVVLWPLSPSWAQLSPPNEAGVSLGAWHTIVRDVEATKKFWELFGATPMKIDGADVMKMHGVFVFMAPGEPAAPTIGALIDHLGILTPQPVDLVKRLIAAGVKTDKINPATMRGPNTEGGPVWTYAYSPDGLRVEILLNEDAVANKDLNAPLQSDMIHLYYKDIPDIRASYYWYRDYFGGRPTPEAILKLRIPGTGLYYALSHDGPRPLNKGGALDYVGFEVKNLEAFCRKLEAGGVKFDQPYSKTRHKSYASAQLSDPLGMPLELTEGLNKF